MIKVLNYNQIMQQEVEEFIVDNIKNELDIGKEVFNILTRDLKDIEKNYIATGGSLLFAYDTDNKKIVGTVAIKFENDIALLKRFYVDKNYRKKKIGYLLYKNIEEQIINKRINRIYLTTGINLKDAHRFYEKNGWMKEKLNPGIYVREEADLYKKEMRGKFMKKEKDILKQADILVEAIPYIQEYNGEIIVVKYGGNAMEDEKKKENVMKQITLLKMLGIKVVLVHGGGPDIEAELKSKNIATKFENGLRVTDKESVEIIKMVLIGKTNSEIVKILNMQNCNAVGLSGLDSNLIKCSMLDSKIGYVGKIEEVDTKLIIKLLEENYTPVISPIGTDNNGNIYNINADTAASEIAIALKAKKMVFLTDIDGLLDKDKNLISLIEKEKIQGLIDDGTINGGMIPKILSCKNCIEKGVEKVHILNGTKENTLIYELLSDSGIGTMIL